VSTPKGHVHREQQQHRQRLDEQVVQLFFTHAGRVALGELKNALLSSRDSSRRKAPAYQ
jgi:hypothetical protein